MAHNMKDNGNRENFMVLDVKSIIMVTLVLGIGTKEKYMDMQNIIINRVLFMWVIGRIMSSTFTGKNHGLMEHHMKEITLKEKKNGKGKLVFYDVSYFEGEFEMDDIHGYGVY